MGPFPFYVRDSTDAELGNAEVAADTPDVVPVAGYESLSLWMVSPDAGGTFTLAVWGKMRNGTFRLIDSYTVTAAGVDLDGIALHGVEYLKLILTNGSTAQKPQVRAVLNPINEAA